MKTNFKYLLFLVATLMIGFSSCDSDDDEPTTVIPEGKETSFKLRLSQVIKTGSTTTRDDNANANETKLTTVNVFIYNATNQLEKTVQLLGSSFTADAGVDGSYLANEPISITTGQKTVYVGLNLTPGIVALIAQSGPSAIQSISLIEELTSSTDGFVMFSKQAVTPILVEDSSNPANTVSVLVERVVAKVALQTTATLSYDVSGGMLSELSYIMRNVNKRFFPLPKIETSVQKDPNWLSLPAGQILAADFYQPDMIGYIPVNPSTVTDNKLLQAKYAVENTSQNKFPDELTYASIRAKFVPASVKVYTNGTDASGGFSDQSNAGNPAATFYRLPLTSGGNVYTLNVEVATDYATASGEDPAKIQLYSSGYCYYNIFLNPDNGYNVVRNQFYKTTISKINGIGNPNPDDKIDHNPLESQTDITVGFQIVDWTLIDFNTQLPGSR